MENIITINKNTISANRFLVGKARTAFDATVSLYEGEIGIGKNGFYEATFKTAKNAKIVGDVLNAQYASASVRMPEPKKTPSSSEEAPKSAKGVAFDFGKIKGDSKSDKNKALHKELVKMGIKDSRTPEYKSVWDARPWAK